MFMEQSPVIMFLGKTKSDDKLCEIYKELRVWLQSAGHTSKSINSVTEAPPQIWKLHHELKVEFEKLKKTLKNYGILQNEKILEDYIQNKFIEINKQYPLVDEL